MSLRRILAAAVAAAIPAIAIGCGERVLLGGSEPVPVPEPVCADAGCGTTCTLSACPPSTPACAAPVMVGYCTGDGTCSPNAPACPPPPPPPCLEDPCGTPCEPACDPGDPNCTIVGPPEGFHCNGMGSCVAGPVACPCMNGPDCPPIWQPCAGAPCGAPCDPCNPMDPTCPPPQVPTVCDGQSSCVPAMMSGCTPLPWDPCAQKTCGDVCQLCPPGNPTCIEPPGPKACDDALHCMLGSISCSGPGDAGPMPMDAGP